MSLLKQEDNFMAQFAKRDSTEIDEAATMDYFVKHFEENEEPPEDFNHNLIDIFLRVLSNTSSDSRRVYATFVIVGLTESKCASLVHTVIEKGALDHFVLCIGTTTEFQHEKLVMNCLVGVRIIAKHCENCLKLVQATDVLEIIAHKMHSGAIHELNQCSAAMSCCRDTLFKADGLMQLETGRLLISAIVNALHRFNIDGNFHENSLDVLIRLAHKGNYSQFDGFADQFGEMLFDAGLISIAMDAIATGNPDIISNALGVLINTFGCINHNESSNTDKQQDKLNMYRGFIKIINDCLDSSWGTVRFRAAWALANAMAPAPSKLLEFFCQEVEVIVQLMCLMHNHDEKLQSEACRVFVNVFEAIADNANDNSYSSLKLFVENGVRAIVDSATKSGADIRLVNMIREVLPNQLSAHHEFCSKAQKFIRVHVPLMVDIIEAKEDIAKALKSLANAIFRGANQTHVVPDPTGGVTTVPENSSSLAK